MQEELAMKKRLTLMSLSLFSAAAIAQVAYSNADQFALQAGTIAGFAQSCGQNIMMLNSRVTDVVNILAKNPGDQQTAMTIYEKAMSDAQYQVSRNRTTTNCDEIISNYNTLPLLRPDYKQTVLPAMANIDNAAATTTAPPPAPNSAPPAPNLAPPASNSPTAENSVAVLNNPPPTQMMVTGNN
jgi:hypothetical protein